MTLKKRLIMLCVLVLTLTLCCFGLVACGSGGNDGGDAPNGGGENNNPIDWALVYTVNEDGSTITGLTEYGKTLTELVIPKTLNRKTITSIGNYAFKNCTSLTSIVIPDSVTSIGYQAFFCCSSLTSIVIPDSVTSIGNSAFAGCTSLNSITIPDSVTSIGSRAFYYCESLTSVVIPDSVTSIGSSAFSGCDNLQYNEYENAYYLGNESNPYLCLIKAKSKDITTCTINDNCKFIYYSAFNCTSLTSIVLPDSVTSIGSNAFFNCTSLNSITIPDSVTSIGNYAFYRCTSLTSVTFENTSGWYVATSSTATSGTEVTVTNATQNATYLKSTYDEYYWKRK